jgi:hypothetical protein
VKSDRPLWSLKINYLSIVIIIATLDLLSAKGVKAEVANNPKSINNNCLQKVREISCHRDRAIAIQNSWSGEKQRDFSNNATDLIARGVTRVTGIELQQRESGLEITLTTVAGSEKLVPLILPEGNNLVVDILDATLAFSIRNGITQTNPAPGIRQVNLVKIDESSIRLTITGQNQAPRAEIIPSRQNLVLSINPQGSTARQTPDEEIEVIATGEGEEDTYYVPDASTATGIDTDIKDTPLSIQVVSPSPHTARLEKPQTPVYRHHHLLLIP